MRDRAHRPSTRREAARETVTKLLDRVARCRLPRPSPRRPALPQVGVHPGSRLDVDRVVVGDVDVDWREPPSTSAPLLQSYGPRAFSVQHAKFCSCTSIA